MIRLPDPLPADSAERFALQLLVDLSRLVPVDDTTADVVRLEVVVGGERPPTPIELADGRWAAVGDGVVRVPRSVLRRVTELAGAVAEQRSTARDRFGRVPPSENELAASGAERDPVVSRAAVRLRDAAVRAAGRRQLLVVPPWPARRRWCLALSHDLDVVALWPLFTLLRVAELARKGRVAQLSRVLAAAAASVAGDPVRRGVRMVLDAEREAGVTSTWFVLCGTPTARTFRSGDLTYRPESPAARRLFSDILEAGHSIGLHGSFATMDTPGEFAAQRARLSSLAAGAPSGVRQHFLRHRPGDTHRAMAAAGFTYDSSVGFADRNGFRLGVADVLPMWDAERAAPLDIDEAPFTWMDRALSKYRGVEDPTAWVEDGLALAERCREVDGLWVGVWHPNLLPALGYPGAPEGFARLVASLMSHNPYAASLDDIIAWRRTRRSVRVAHVTEGGAVELIGGGGIVTHLETADDRRSPVQGIAGSR